MVVIATAGCFIGPSTTPFCGEINSFSFKNSVQVISSHRMNNECSHCSSLSVITFTPCLNKFWNTNSLTPSDYFRVKVFEKVKKIWEENKTEVKGNFCQPLWIIKLYVICEIIICIAFFECSLQQVYFFMLHSGSLISSFVMPIFRGKEIIFFHIFV